MPRRRISELVFLGATFGLIMGLVLDPMGPGPDPASGSPAETRHQITIHGGDDATATLIRGAVARFDVAGLVLPDIEFFVHGDDDLTPCGGHRGFWHHHIATDRVDICVPGESLVLHELAHAWDHHSVDDTTRDAFMALFPDEAWVDANTSHAEQGIERFADAVTWGLESRPDQAGVVMGRHASMVRQQNIDTFVLITGVEPLRLTDPI